MKSEPIDMTQQRRSANYKPNIWEYDFIESLTSKYDAEKHKKRAEELKKDVKTMFAEVKDQLAKLELIDIVGKLGLENLFKQEIKEALDTIALDNNLIVAEDLYATALSFRVLRQNGYKVSSDMFKGFMDEKGTFIESIATNNKGLLELFEASHLVVEGENILDEAKVFSSGNLNDIVPNLDGILAKQVAHALELPLQRRVKWFDVKWHINAYEKEKCVSSILLELAKLNFNMIQTTHQKDLREMSRWWRNLGLIGNLSFARDRLVESFLCSVGFAFDPQYTCFRKWLTKTMILIMIFDDIYDVYGSLEELEHFTNAIERWDLEEIQQLPECMKICFQALYNVINEFAYEIQKDIGWNQVLPHLRKVWIDFCKSLFVEAKWYYKGHTPTLEEYLSNGWISSSGSVILLHAFLSLTHETEEMKDFLVKIQDHMYNSSMIFRLCNDLGTSVAEQERGDAPSSIICYMRQLNVSEGIAQKHIEELINKTWKRINRQCVTQSSLLQPFVNVSTNLARVSHYMYQHGDGVGVQDREIRNEILSLLIEPLN